MRVTTLLLLMIALLTAACAQQPAPTPTPQSAASATPQDGASPAAAAPVPLDRPTLPPTWTPVGGLEPTVAFVEPTLDPTVETLRALPTLAACAGFAVDFTLSQNEFIPGQPVIVVWGPAAQIARYQITLYNSVGTAIYIDTVTDTLYTFPGNQFVEGEYYTWDVRPFDQSGIMFCVPIGNDIKRFLG